MLPSLSLSIILLCLSPLEAKISKSLYALFRQLPRAILLERFSEYLTIVQN